jgi:hypothetical protein
MRQTAQQRKRKAPRHTGGKKPGVDCNDSATDGWDQFEALVMWIAASRAMAQFRQKAISSGSTRRTSTKSFTKSANRTTVVRAPSIGDATRTLDT